MGISERKNEAAKFIALFIACKMRPLLKLGPLLALLMEAALGSQGVKLRTL